MIVTEINIPLKLPSPAVPRTKGVHQSAIIKSMAIEGGHLDKKWVDADWEPTLEDSGEITDHTAILRISIGLAWEEWYLPQLAELGVIDHPGELCVEGIHMTPDGESVDVIITQEDTQSHELIIHEVKATYKSARTYHPDNAWMHVRQLMGYCKGKKTRYGMLHVLFLCGDYHRPIEPDRKVWLLEFSQSEIDASWQQLKGYRDNIIRAQKKGT